jgi:integrase
VKTRSSGPFPATTVENKAEGAGKYLDRVLTEVLRPMAYSLEALPQELLGDLGISVLAVWVIDPSRLHLLQEVGRLMMATRALGATWFASGCGGLPPPALRLVLLLAHTGLRWGEAAGLKVGRVDFLRRRILVAQTLIDDKTTGGLVWSTPKTHQRREVPLSPWLAHLARYVWWAPGVPNMGQRRAALGTTGRENGLVPASPPRPSSPPVGRVVVPAAEAGHPGGEDRRGRRRGRRRPSPSCRTTSPSDSTAANIATSRRCRRAGEAPAGFPAW